MTDASPEAAATLVAETPTDDAAAVADPVIDTTAPEAEVAEEVPADVLRKQLDKARREAQGLRTRLKEQEPVVAAAQEAERANMSELDRVKTEKADLESALTARETELLQSKYGISDDDLDLLGTGSFEEKEARAQRIRALSQPQQSTESTQPPTQRPVESLKPGASTQPPPVADTSYPANWGFKPPSQ